DSINASIATRAAAIAANSSIVLTGRTPQQQQTLRNLIDAIRAARPPMPGAPTGGSAIASPITASGVGRYVTGVIAGPPPLASVTPAEAFLVALVEALLAAGILIVLG